MKLQVGGQHWRVRINEDELTRLRDGQPLVSTSTLPGNAVLRFELELVPGSQASVASDGGSWKISLPTASVDAYVQRLPCRDGVEFTFPVTGDAALELVFEVDVRDSVRRRGVVPRRRP